MQKKLVFFQFFILFLLLSFSVHSQIYVRAVYPGGGNYPNDVFSGFDKLYLSREQPPILFRQDSLSGPAILVDGSRLKLESEEINPYKFFAVKDGIKYSLFLRPNIALRSFIFEVEMRKVIHNAIRSRDVSLQLGFDIGNLSSAPKNQVYYPTILRKEENTLWGCLTTPNNKVVAVACPQPIKQVVYWRLDNKTQTIKIDLQSKDDSPITEYNEARKWSISVAAVPSTDSLKNVICTISKIATIDLKRSCCFQGETVKGYVHTKTPVILTLTYPSGQTQTFEPILPKEDENDDDNNKDKKPLPPGIPFQLEDLTVPGVYMLTVSNPDGLKTTAGFTILRPLSEIIEKEIHQALKTPTPTSPDDFCYADLLVLIAGRYFPEYQTLSEERFHLIQKIFIHPQTRRLNLNAVTTPESGLFLLELALLKNDTVFANAIAEYFSRMQLPNGALFYPKTKEDLTSSTTLLTLFLQTAEANRRAGNTEEAEKYEKVLRKALSFLKSKAFDYDESLPQNALFTAESFLRFANSSFASTAEKNEFFRFGEKLLKAIECHIQKENSSAYFHSSYATPIHTEVALQADPTAVYLDAAATYYELTGKEDYLLYTLNALATMTNRSRETEQHPVVHTESGESSHCHFFATMLLEEYLLEKAYIYVESPQTVRGYHCFINEIEENTVTVAVTDEAVHRIHIRTTEPVRFAFQTPRGVFYKTVAQSGWIDLDQ